MQATIETAKARAVGMIKLSEDSRRPITGTRVSGLSLRQPVFNWGTKDKYTELKHF